jgi:hypothetical protein
MQTNTRLNRMGSAAIEGFCRLPATRYPLPAQSGESDVLNSRFALCIVGTWLTTETSRYGKRHTD